MVVTVVQAPPSLRTISPHWLTETTTSTTSPGQAAGSPEETAARFPDSLPPAEEQAVRASAARAAGTTRDMTTPLLKMILITSMRDTATYRLHGVTGKRRPAGPRGPAVPGRTRRR